MKETKDKKIEVRLTEKEKQRIQDKAKELGMTTSEFVRMACIRIFAD